MYLNTGAAKMFVKASKEDCSKMAMKDRKNQQNKMKSKYTKQGVTMKNKGSMGGLFNTEINPTMQYYVLYK